jgi:hypothetical protein
MAIFNKNSLTQVSGFDNPLLTGELVWNQKTYWNLTFNRNEIVNGVCTPVPVNFTNATISASIVRRELSNLIDTRNGLKFDISNYTPTPNSINLTVTNVGVTAGVFTLVINDTAWSLINSDSELKIDAVNPVGFSGRILVSFPALGTTPAYDWVVFLLFIVRSDGVVVI